MTKHQKFFLCKHCGNLAGLIIDQGVPIYCCSEPMTQLEANTTDGAQEKHGPVVQTDGRHVNVAVGSTAHPMKENHYIQFVYLQTCCGGQRKSLRPNEAPKVQFALAEGETPKAVYSYCNRHGLWKTDLV